MNPTYCSFLWRRLTFSGDGTLRPCCRFEGDAFPEASRDAVGAYNGEFFRAIRSKMLAGEKVAGCTKCYQQESSGARSLRQTANAELGVLKGREAVEPANITSTEIFLGRECNLKCRMCGPLLSSKWHEDARAIGWDPSQYKNDETSPADRVRPFVESLRHLKLLGGEPLIASGHDELIDLLVSDGAPEITRLEYATNVTVFPRPELIAQWEQFSRVCIGLSIDGVGEVNSLIRYPAKWDLIEKNTRAYFDLAKRMKNVEIFLASTIGAYNMHDVPRLLEWWNELKPEGLEPRQALEAISATRQPSYLSATVLPEFYKSELIRRFEAIGDYRGLMSYTKSADHSHLLPEFVGFSAEMDRLRNQNTLKMIPELAPVFEYSHKVLRANSSKFLGAQPT